MLYPLFEMNHLVMQPFRLAAAAGQSFWGNASNPMANSALGRNTAAALSLFERATRRYGKPAFNIQDTVIEGTAVAITEEIAWSSPFCNLIHFSKPALEAQQPKMLLVAPLSGHHATLLRDTVKSMLPEFDCYVTDWQDARDIPVGAGSFDLDDYTDTLITILHHLKTRAHVMAVCQPSVPVLAAVSLMAMADDPLQPLSMTLMGGPIDTRRNPTGVNKLAEEKGIGWFKTNAVMKVSGFHEGYGRSVYPGFLQLGGFLAMNLDRHMKAHRDLYRDLVDGDEQDAQKHESFYDEYMAVMDLTAEFYLQTVERVFLYHDLPNGTYRHRAALLEPSKITRTALLTIEGERDDISGVGQTEAAHDLCSGLKPEQRRHHLQLGVGHYGVFSGSKYRREVAPLIIEFAKTHNR